MTINYPNGRKREKSGHPENEHKTQRINFGNRGMSLEFLLNEANEYYRAHHIANIHKKPTPIQIVKVDYPHRTQAKITEAYFQKASTTDYNGIFDGKYIDFEAKETQNKTSFPLSNIHDHQIEHMLDIRRHGGCAFLIIYFKLHDEMLLTPIEVISKAKRLNKKSIGRQDLQTESFEIQRGSYIRADYISALKLYMEVYHE